MKNKKLLLSVSGILILCCLFFSFKSQILVALKNYDLSTYNVISGKTRTKFLTNGSLTDSTEVHNLSSGETRRVAPLATILANYATTISLNDYMTTSAANSAISTIQTSINGKANNSNTITVNGVSATLGSNPVFNVKSVATYSGTTNASGNYTVTFITPYTVAPNVQANIIAGTDTQTIRITSVSATAVTVLVRNRVDVIGLLPTYNNVSGANVDIIVTPK